MTFLHKPIRMAACLLLASAVSLAAAQTASTKPAAKPADKTLGGKPTGGGKLMTRDELRTCLNDPAKREQTRAQAQKLRLLLAQPAHGTAADWVAQQLTKN